MLRASSICKYEWLSEKNSVRIAIIFNLFLETFSITAWHHSRRINSLDCVGKRLMYIRACKCGFFVKNLGPKFNTYSIVGDKL
jgi:hypothetical protein